MLNPVVSAVLWREMVLGQISVFLNDVKDLVCGGASETAFLLHIRPYFYVVEVGDGDVFVDCVKA